MAPGRMILIMETISVIWAVKAADCSGVMFPVLNDAAICGMASSSDLNIMSTGWMPITYRASSMLMPILASAPMDAYSNSFCAGRWRCMHSPSTMPMTPYTPM